ncbi:MAG TPA: hypothetical protein VM529_00355 [Gemmata sp.]|nr:hypothetical protein [Gemmata sp.]
MTKHLISLAAACLVVVHAPPAAHTQVTPEWKWYEVKDGKVQIHLHVFWSRTCPHCTTARDFLGGLKKRHDWLKVFEYEVSGPQRTRTSTGGWRRVSGSRPGRSPRSSMASNWRWGIGATRPPASGSKKF